MSLWRALDIRRLPSFISLIRFPFPVVIWWPSLVHDTSSMNWLFNLALQANTKLPPGITSASLGSWRAFKNYVDKRWEGKVSRRGQISMKNMYVSDYFAFNLSKISN